MVQKFKNDSRARLASGINAAATTIVLEAGYGDLFPVANMGTGTVGDWFKCTLESDLGVKEVVKVRTRTAGSDLLENVVRAQEGYTAIDWASGSVIGLRLTAADVEASLAQDWSAIPEEVVSDGPGYKVLTVDCRGNHVDTDSVDIRIPSATFEKGDIVVVYNNTAANRKITPLTGVTLVWDGGETGERTLEADGLCSIFCVAADKFRIIGAGLS